MSEEDNDKPKDLNEDGVASEETEIRTPEMEDLPDEAEWNPFEETDDDFQPTRIRMVRDAGDGLPGPIVDDAHEEDIPPLSPETLVCMEDTSKFVRRDSLGRILKEYDPEEVVRMPNGKWYLRTVVEKIGEHPADAEAAEVQPIRPRCAHYVRQMGQGSLNATMREHYRLCSARRTTEGAFMSVRNQGLWACSMRSPRDMESEQKLEDFDEMKIEQGAKRVHQSIFGRAGNG